MDFAEEEMWAAWERVQENAGCAGADGVTVEAFARRAGQRIAQLVERVRQERYRPYPLLEIVVEKKPGSEATRRLLVPSVGDRLLQTAVARYLSRSFEEEFLECSYGYRPGRSVDRAIARIRKCHELGYRFVVDADITAYFDHVDHRLLLQRLGSRPLGATVQGLLRAWVKAQVWNGHKIYPLRAGVPQGSPISPLLANFYLEDFDRELEKSGQKLVRYADDFLVLSQTAEEAQRALLETETLLAAEHLKLNEGKTRIADFEHGFRFLGALFLEEGIWIPWKHQARRGRILSMARPLPATLRARYETAPPKSAMELALTKAEIIAPPRVSEKGEAVAYLYLTEQGSILRKAGDRLLVEREDQLLLDIPYHKLEAVLLFGNIQVTTQAMGELLDKGVHLSLFTLHGVFRGSLTPARGKNVELRIAQFTTFRDHEKSMANARATVAAKIANGTAVLQSFRRHSDPGGEFDARLKTLEESAARCAGAADLEVLNGIEGAAARDYFDLLMRFNRSELAWKGRIKHPPTDPLNALLSLTYTLVEHELRALAEGVGLDVAIGFMHQPDYGRPSLALDLVEAFRHATADRLVMFLVNKRMLEEGDFESGGEGRGVVLKPKSMTRYFAEYERWMLKKAEGRTSFRELLRTEVERLCGSLREGTVFEPWRLKAGDEPEV